MSEKAIKKREPRHRMIHGARLALGLISIAAPLASVACGPAKAPPHVVEVPIDQFAGAAGPAPVGDPVNPGAPPSNVEAVSEPSASNAAPAATSPMPLPSNDSATGAAPGPAVPTFGTHAKPVRALRLTAADCSRVMDKYIQLVAMGQGLTAAQAFKAVPSMKAQVQNDPNYASAQSTCVDSTSRKQYQCAMKAGTVDAWKVCVQ